MYIDIQTVYMYVCMYIYIYIHIYIYMHINIKTHAHIHRQKETEREQGRADLMEPPLDLGFLLSDMFIFTYLFFKFCLLV